MNFFSSTFNPFSIFTGSGGIFESISNPSSWWDKFKNGETNTTNKAIADENLNYQKDYNELMQSNYEDEKEYNRALQERLFNREDTAIERQAQSLSNLGINPLSQNMNGLGAGNVVGNPNPSGVQPLHNDYQHQDFGMLPMLSALSSLASTVNGVSTGTYQRDALALENDAKYLENYKLAHSMGLDYGQMTTSKTKRNTSMTKSIWDSDKNESYTFIYPDLGNNPEFMETRGNYFRGEKDKKREYDHKLYADLYDTDSPQGRMIKDLGNLDFVSLAENLLTKFAKTGDNIGKKFGKDFGAENALSKFFSLFY